MVACLVCDPSHPPGRGVLDAVARACSPRVEPHGETAAICDVDGLTRVCGPRDVIAREIVALAASQGIGVRVAVAGTRTAAWILAHARAGETVVPPGAERAALADLPVGWLGSIVDLDDDRAGARDGEGRPNAGPSFYRGRGRDRGRLTRPRHFRAAPSPGGLERPAGSGAPAPVAEGQTSLPARAAVARRRRLEACRERLATFERWGLRTIGAVADLPRADLHARMGPLGVRLHQAACGEDVAPLTPAEPVVPFADRLDLEWPIEGLEPLSFVLARQFDRLSAALERADRGAVVVTTRLTLVTGEVHARTLSLPSPMRDARVLRTLVLLDLESHPPSAGIDVVEIVLGVTPGRIVEGSLLARSLPAPEDLATLVARLGALMGESRVGAPVVPDTWDERRVAMQPFRLPATGGAMGGRVVRRAPAGDATPAPTMPALVLRRFRLPLAARVRVEHGVPVHVAVSTRGLAGGAVVGRAGPWRSSGHWWTLDGAAWDRDEWDLALADGGIYRVTRDRVSGAWDVEGLFD